LKHSEHNIVEWPNKSVLEKGKSVLISRLLEWMNCNLIFFLGFVQIFDFDNFRYIFRTSRSYTPPFVYYFSYIQVWFELKLIFNWTLTTVDTKNATLSNCSYEAPCEWNFKKLVRCGKSSIGRRECDQPGPFPIIRLQVTAVWKCCCFVSVLFRICFCFVSALFLLCFCFVSDWSLLCYCFVFTVCLLCVCFVTPCSDLSFVFPLNLHFFFL
jgi:hypothetical protein